MDSCFITHLKLEHCTRCYARIVIFSISKDLYYNHPSTKNGTLEITQFLKELKKLVPDTEETEEQKQMRKEIRVNKRFGNLYPTEFEYNFKTEEEEKINLDISFCFLLIDVLKTNYTNKLPNAEVLFSNIDRMREIRNRIMHENIEENKLNDLQKQLIDILTHLSNYMGSITKKTNFEICLNRRSDYYTELISKIIGEITEFWEIEFKLTNNVFEELVRYSDNETLLKKCVTACQNKLVEVYQRFLSLSDFLPVNGSTIHLKGYFVSLDLHNSFNGRKVEWDKIFETGDAEGILLLGDAGQGKTTLCKKLIYDWMQSVTEQNVRGEKTKIGRHLNHFDFILLVKTKGVEDKELSDYLRKMLFPDLIKNASSDMIYKFLRKLNLLVLIDSVNEASDNGINLISSCLDLLGNKKIIITSRNSHSTKAVSFFQNYNLNKNQWKYHLPESKENIKNLKNLLVSVEDQDNFEGFVDSLPVHFKDSLDLALTNLLLHLWVRKGNCDQGFVTLGTLYTELINCLEREHIIEKQLIDNVVALIAADCFEKCLSNNFENKYIDKDVIQKIKINLEENDLGKTEILKVLGSLFSFSPRFHNDQPEGIEYEYEFLHESQAKWLTAKHVYRLIIKKDLDVFKKLKIFFSQKEGNDVITFIFGFLNANNKLNQEFISNILKTENINEMNDRKFNLLWEILKQTMNNKPNSKTSLLTNPKICKYLKNYFYHDREWKLNGTNVVSALTIIRSTSVQPKTIEIEVKDSQVANKSWSKSFFSAIEGVNSKMNNSDRAKIELCLKFEPGKKKKEISHYEYLKCIGPYWDLIRFSGYLNTKEMKLLNEFKKLKELIVLVDSDEIVKSLCDVCNEKEKPRDFMICLIIHQSLSELNVDTNNKYYYKFDGAQLSLKFITVGNWNHVKNVLEKFKESRVTKVIIGKIPKPLHENVATTLPIPKEATLVVQNGHSIDEPKFVCLSRALPCKLEQWNEFP